MQAICRRNLSVASKLKFHGTVFALKGHLF